MAKTYIVLGLSEFALSTALGLAAEGKQVVVIDRDEKLIQQVANSFTRAICADVLNTEVLEKLGIRDFDVAVVGLARHLDVMVLVVHYLHRIKVPIIVAQVTSEAAAEAIRVVGATETVFPERDSASRIVNSLLYPGILDSIDVSDDSAIIEVEAPEKYVGKSLHDLDLRKKHNVHVIGIKRDSPKTDKRLTFIAPPPDMKFAQGDSMLLLGKRRTLDTFMRNIEIHTNGDSGS